MKKIRQTNFYTTTASDYPKMWWLQRAAVMIIATFSHNILGYSDAAQLQRRSTDTVKELVLRCCVYWPNRLGWRQKVLQPPSMFMLLSWWCPLGHDKRHLPAIQIFIAVQLIPILTHLSSRWTVPLISWERQCKEKSPYWYKKICENRSQEIRGTGLSKVREICLCEHAGSAGSHLFVGNKNPPITHTFIWWIGLLLLCTESLKKCRLFEELFTEWHLISYYCSLLLLN